MSAEFRKALDTAALVGGSLGAVLLLSAPLTWFIAGSLGPLVMAKLLLGAALTGGFIVVRARGARGAGLRAQVWGLGTEFLFAGLVVGLAVGFNALVVIEDRAVDLSAQRVHTLGEETLELLRELESPVEIVAFYGPADDGVDVARDLLERYQRASPRVSVTVADPTRRLDLVSRFSARRRGHRIFVVGKRTTRALEASEEEVTTAIMRAIRESAVRLYWSTDHAEADPTDEGPTGASLAREAADAVGYVSNHGPLLRGLSPSDSQTPQPLLILIGPRGEFTADEQRALDHFLSKGGRALLALEPGSEPNLGEFLTRWKIEVGTGTLHDPNRQHLGLGPAAPVIGRMAPDHPTVRDLGHPILMNGARPLRPLVKGEPRVLATPVLGASRNAFVVGGAPGAPEPEPRPHPEPYVAIASTRELGDGHSGHGHAHTSSHQGRLFVTGDADWIQNRLAGQPGNQELFRGALQWLGEDDEAIHLRPPRRPGTAIPLTLADVRTLELVAMDLIPMFLIAIGAVIVQLRRRL